MSSEQFDKRDIPGDPGSDQQNWQNFLRGSSVIARAVMALPDELLNRLPELRENYLQHQKKMGIEKDIALIDAVEVNSQKYNIRSYLGSGDEATSFLADCAGVPQIVKIFKRAESVAIHIEETIKARDEGLPILNIVDHDLSQGIIILEGKIGVPFDFLLNSEGAGLSEQQEFAVLELFVAFKKYHNLLTLSSGNLAFSPETRGVFILDLF